MVGGKSVGEEDPHRPQLVLFLNKTCLAYKIPRDLGGVHIKKASHIINMPSITTDINL